MTKLRAWAEAALPWGILGLMAAGVLGGPQNEGIQRLVQQNGAVLVLVAIIIQYAPRAIAAQTAQAAAMADLAASVRELPRRDDLKFEQVLVGLQHLAEQVERLEDHVRTGGSDGARG